jgi:hypothetical protein
MAVLHLPDACGRLSVVTPILAALPAYAENPFGGELKTFVFSAIDFSTSWYAKYT